MKESLRRHVPLLLILVAALAARFLWMHFLTGSINGETAQYVRIAQNLLAGRGYVSLIAGQTELMYPPFFPALIMVASRLIPNWQAAGQCASIIVGALIVLPMFAICRLLYDDKVATVGALLTGFHPLLLHISAQGLSEGPYLTVLLAAVYFSLRAFRFAGAKYLTLAGVFFGLAYLTRPEAFLYPFLATAFVVLRHSELRVTRRAILLLVSFFLVATPYIWFLSRETGHLSFEGKTRLIHFMNQSAATGKSPWAIDESLNEEGGWIRSRRSVIHEAHATLAGGLKYAAAAAPSNIAEIIGVLTGSKWLGSPVLFALVVLGLFRKRWPSELSQYQAFLFGIMLLQAIALLLKATHFLPRYYSVFLPFLLVWAAQGMIELSQWAYETALALGRSALGPARVEGLVRWASVGALFLSAALGVFRLNEFKEFGPESRVFSEVGLWLKQQGPSAKTVMDTTVNVAFHSGADFLPLPECDSAVALRYFDKKHPNFIVLRTAHASKRRYLQDWLQNGIPDRRAQLVYSRRTAAFGEVRIYRWNVQESAPAPGTPLG